MLRLMVRPVALRATVRASLSTTLPLISSLALRNATPFSSSHRHISTAPPTPSPFRSQPPRFGAPSGPFSNIWATVPDGLKTGLLLIGGCATLMVVGPLFFFLAPPLFLGGFFLMTRRLRRREKDMTQRWELLKNTTLVYNGSELDQVKLQRFVQNRLMEAVELDEGGITKALCIEKSTRLGLTELETIDEDIRVARGLAGTGEFQGLTVISFGLVDKTNVTNLKRVATVLVTLKPRAYTTLLQNHNSSEQDCVIEVLPLMPFKKSVVIDTGTAGSDTFSGRTIDIKAKRTSSR
ncbi:hypothetical protein BON22_2577 [Cyberlindnera fabianii]|uniref:Uncharacterized protein n=1 Tax=Cyberlindnera fabianii TaxID=36022 RepID=A0A1V2L7F1_CYBFA|nr:hypothetical protein BON22_2577 [Cyberlindnera fabianii]